MYLATALSSLLVQFFGFIMCVTLFPGKGDKYYDLFGSVGFYAQMITVYILKQFKDPADLSEKESILMLCIVVWTMRLGSFLVIRAHTFNGDKRFDKIKYNLPYFAFMFFLQFLWNYICVLPSLIVFTKNNEQMSNILDYLGIFTYMTGLIIESVADYQKFKFKLQKENEGKFISSGLWSRCRHPNYLGEFMVWIGLYVASVSSYTNIYEHLAIFSPIFIVFLIWQVSGIKILERNADKKWGNNSAYQQYKEKTGIILFKF